MKDFELLYQILKLINRIFTHGINMHKHGINRQDWRNDREVNKSAKP